MNTDKEIVFGVAQTLETSIFGFEVSPVLALMLKDMYQESVDTMYYGGSYEFWLNEVHEHQREILRLAVEMSQPKGLAKVHSQRPYLIPESIAGKEIVLQPSFK